MCVSVCVRVCVRVHVCVCVCVIYFCGWCQIMCHSFIVIFVTIQSADTIDNYRGELHVTRLSPCLSQQCCAQVAAQEICPS